MTSYVTLSNGGGSSVTTSKIKYQGLTVAKQKVWSSDTGRSTTALMQGKIIAIKYTFKIEFTSLTAQEYQNIENIVTNTSYQYFSATVCDGVITHSATVYADSTSVKVYNDNIGKYFDYSLELIER